MIIRNIGIELESPQDYVASDCDMFMHVCMYQCFMVYGRMVNQWFINVLIMVYGLWLYGLWLYVLFLRHRATSTQEGRGAARRGVKAAENYLECRRRRNHGKKR